MWDLVNSVRRVGLENEDQRFESCTLASFNMSDCTLLNWRINSERDDHYNRSL